MDNESSSSGSSNVSMCRCCYKARLSNIKINNSNNKQSESPSIKRYLRIDEEHAYNPIINGKVLRVKLITEETLLVRLDDKPYPPYSLSSRISQMISQRNEGSPFVCNTSQTSLPSESVPHFESKRVHEPISMTTRFRYPFSENARTNNFVHTGCKSGLDWWNPPTLGVEALRVKAYSPRAKPL